VDAENSVSSLFPSSPFGQNFASARVPSRPRPQAMSPPLPSCAWIRNLSLNSSARPPLTLIPPNARVFYQLTAHRVPLLSRSRRRAPLVQVRVLIFRLVSPLVPSFPSNFLQSPCRPLSPQKQGRCSFHHAIAKPSGSPPPRPSSSFYILQASNPVAR